ARPPVPSVSGDPVSKLAHDELPSRKVVREPRSFESGPEKPAKGTSTVRKIRWRLLMTVFVVIVTTSCGVALWLVLRPRPFVATVPATAPNTPNTPNTPNSEIGLRVDRARDGQLDIGWRRDAAEIHSARK